MTMAVMAMVADITKGLLAVVQEAVTIVAVYHVVATSTEVVTGAVDAVKIAAEDTIADKTERDPIRKMIFPS